VRFGKPSRKAQLKEIYYLHKSWDRPWHTSVWYGWWRRSCNGDRVIDAQSTTSIAGSADVKPDRAGVLNADTFMQTMKDFGMQESQKICIICLAWKSSLEGCGVVVGKWSRLFSGALPRPLFDRYFKSTHASSRY
jgi:hypothetical protein